MKPTSFYIDWARKNCADDIKKLSNDHKKLLFGAKNHDFSTWSVFKEGVNCIKND